eukprot:181558-Chlamydomonas_euryale.AAC.1
MTSNGPKQNRSAELLLIELAIQQGSRHKVHDIDERLGRPGQPPNLLTPATAPAAAAVIQVSRLSDKPQMWQCREHAATHSRAARRGALTPQ